MGVMQRPIQTLNANGVVYLDGDKVARTSAGVKSDGVNVSIGEGGLNGNQKLLLTCETNKPIGLRYTGVATWYVSLTAGGDFLLDKDGTELMRVSAAGVPTFATIDPRSLGLGQTWQGVTASRALNTIYTNTTGRPIAIAGHVSDLGAAQIKLTIAGVIVLEPGISLSFFGIVPPGATYIVNLTAGSGSIGNFVELK